MPVVRPLPPRPSLETLKGVVLQHPDLLRPSEFRRAKGGTLIACAIHGEREHGREFMRPIVEWLEGQGCSRQRALDIQLCFGRRGRDSHVRTLLDLGADPTWVAANGYSVLEHALLTYWNGDDVDLIAARVTPPNAFWVAAGLGDVAGVRRFLDRDGRPTKAARSNRPPFDSIGIAMVPLLPDPDDEELLLEAFVVAVFNQRIAVMEYMTSRGFPVDSMKWGMPIVNLAVGNAWTSVVECLVRAGANLDIPDSNRSNGTAREMARYMWEHGSYGGAYRRIVELCGLDADTLLAERDATTPPPTIFPQLVRALERAADDAARAGATQVEPEHLLFGVLRGDEMAISLARRSGMDRDRFVAEHRQRLAPGDTTHYHAPVPRSSFAQSMIDEATALAARRRREHVYSSDLLWALTRDEHGHVASLLRTYG